jgi:hypothetical protein
MGHSEKTNSNAKRTGRAKVVVTHDETADDAGDDRDRAKAAGEQRGI